MSGKESNGDGEVCKYEELQAAEPPQQTSADSSSRPYHEQVLPFEILYQCPECEEYFVLLGDVPIGQTERLDKTLNKCQLCHRQFKEHKTFLIHHIKRHVGYELFQCSRCIEIFTSQKQFYAHIEKHMGMGSRQCPLCYKSFITEEDGDLDEHLRSHQVEKPYVCRDCDISCSTAQSLFCHMNAHKNQCFLCKESFETTRALFRHLSDDYGVRSGKCPICYQTFQSDRDLSSHWKEHKTQKPFSCKECAKVFRNQANLFYRLGRQERKIRYKCCSAGSSNQANDSTQVPYSSTEKIVCWMCQQSFPSRQSLNTHMNIHLKRETGQHQCPHCEKYFASKRKLTNHRRLRHPNNKDKMHKCLICNMTFLYESKLYHHMKEHSKKTCKCPTCDITFNNEIAFKKHQEVCGHSQVTQDQVLPASSDEAVIKDSVQTNIYGESSNDSKPVITIEQSLPVIDMEHVQAFIKTEEFEAAEDFMLFIPYKIEQSDVAADSQVRQEDDWLVNTEDLESFEDLIKFGPPREEQEENVGEEAVEQDGTLMTVEETEHQREQIELQNDNPSVFVGASVEEQHDISLKQEQIELHNDNQIISGALEQHGISLKQEQIELQNDNQIISEAPEQHCISLKQEQIQLQNDNQIISGAPEQHGISLKQDQIKLQNAAEEEQHGIMVKQQQNVDWIESEPPQEKSLSVAATEEQDSTLMEVLRVEQQDDIGKEEWEGSVVAAEGQGTAFIMPEEADHHDISYCMS